MFLCGRFTLPLNRPLIMGIVNVTPDSFFDGGHHASAATGIAHAHRLIEEGVDILDIGGESSRPGAQPVSVDEELRRVLPIVEALQGCNVPLSVDTCKIEVMRAAIAAGADMINDINALQGEGALDAVASSSAAVCLMHRQGTSQTMQNAPAYSDVVSDVMAFLAARIAAAQAAGIGRERLVIDPGFGFGKSMAHNVALLRQLDRFQALEVPLLAGLSRKSMLGQITGLDVDERLIPSIAAAVIAAMKGAKIIRVHDVKASKEALQIINAMRENNV